MAKITKAQECPFQAFCDDNRKKILKLLCDGEMCGSELLTALQIGQSTLSHHMAILSAAELVKCWRDGHRTYYSIDQSGVKHMQDVIAELTTVKPPGEIGENNEE